MALLRIVRFPDPFLRQPTVEVTEFDATLRKLVADMTETMYAKNGAGLAAIQVGSPLKLYIIEPTVAHPPNAARRLTDSNARASGRDARMGMGKTPFGGRAHIRTWLRPKV